MTGRRKRNFLLPLILLTIFIGSVAGRSLFYHSHISARGVKIVHSHLFGGTLHDHTTVALDSIDVLLAMPVDCAPDVASAPEAISNPVKHDEACPTTRITPAANIVCLLRAPPAV